MQLVMKLSVLFVLLCIYPGASILIVGPRIIRRNQDYKVVISNILGESNNDCLLNVRIERAMHAYRSILVQQTVKVMAESNKTITFKIPNNVTDGDYKIVIEGKQPSTSSINNIHKKAQLFYGDHLEKPLGLIQLSKPVITPGESLKFRIILLNIDLKLAMSHKTSVSVYVSDPNHAVIQHWSNVNLYNGIFENQITIPTIPVLGTYQVRAMANDRFMESKAFEVKNYDMYSIDLNIYPTIIPFRWHQCLNLTIDAKNNLGKPVRGNLTIFPIRTTFEEYLTTKTYTKNVNGVQQMLIPFRHRLEIGRNIVILNVTFIEHFTNRIISREQDIKVYGSKYKVRLHNKTLKYLPGSPFTTTMTVVYQNDEPAKNVTLLVELKGLNKLYRQKCTSNMNGQLKFAMDTNKSMELYHLKVYHGVYQLVSVSIEDVYSAHVLTDKYIKVELLTRVKFNRNLRLLVTCSENMNILLYYVVSKGNLVEFGSFRPNQMSRYSFEIMMSDELIPRAKVIVFTVVRESLMHGAVELSINEFGNPVKTKHIRHQKQPIEMPHLFQLEIKIEENIGEDGVDPGDEIELAIRGRPGAFVVLTAYDQRLMQHSEDHDILFADIWKLVDTPYDRDTLLPYSSIDEFGIFAVVTDDTIIGTDFFEYDTRGIYPNAPRYGMPGPYRTESWESWLWQNLTIPPSGRYALEVTVPHSTTSWYITGITIDPKYGLGVVKKPITFSTVKIFFILDHLPHSIKRGETVSLHFTLFSSIGEEFKANVTMFNAKNQIQFANGPAGDATKIVSLPSNSDAPVSFLIKAMKLGELEIRVNASIMQGIISDSLKKIILVNPEDMKVVKTERIHFDRDTPSSQSFNIPLLIDKKAEAEVVPVDLIVYPNQQSLKNLQNNYNVSIFYDRFEKSMHVNSEYNENITIKSIPGFVRILPVIVTGSRSGMIQINWQYRLSLIHFMSSFDLKLTKLPTPSEWMKELHICFRFIPEDRYDYTNSAHVEVSIPIGYAMDSHNVDDGTTINRISRTETLHGGTTLMVYYNHIGNETNCFSAFAYRRYKMREKHPSYIKVQDIQRPELNAIKMFDFH